MWKKYKLLKDLPNAKAWEYELDQSKQFEVVLTNWTYSFNIFNSWLNNKEWFEEIKEVKSIYDLWKYNIYYYIGFTNSWKQYIYECIPDQNHNMINARVEIWEAFLSRKEAETELQKRKAMATIKKWSHDNDPKNINNWGWYMELNINWDYIVINEVVMYKMAWVQYYTNHEIAERAFKELQVEYKILFNINEH